MNIRVLLLSDASNPHTMRWGRALTQRGLKVSIFSFQRPRDMAFWDKLKVEVKHPTFLESKFFAHFPYLKKLGYPFAIFDLLKTLIIQRPDIVHAHHASSYGLLGALAAYKPYFISVWGSDVFEFPAKSTLLRKVLEFNLSRANRIFSTSWIMKQQTSKFTNKGIEVIPFGVDLNHFVKRREGDNGIFKIGIIKSLEEKYGIQFLIEAFSLVKKEFQNMPLQLLIVGSGSYEENLKQKALDRGVANEVHFLGRVSIDQVPSYHNLLDIAVYPSICEESFGVAVIESSACEVPVIVTRRGGLTEVVEEDVTGLVVESNNAEAIANALKKLISDPDLRMRLGKAGRSKVIKLYNWDENVSAMIKNYESFVN